MTSKGDLFYFTEKVDNTVEVVEVIVESVDENLKDWDIIHVNKEYIVPPINSFLTAEPNTTESCNMEDNKAFIKKNF